MIGDKIRVVPQRGQISRIGRIDVKSVVQFGRGLNIGGARCCRQMVNHETSSGVVAAEPHFVIAPLVFDEIGLGLNFEIAHLAEHGVAATKVGVAAYQATGDIQQRGDDGDVAGWHHAR